MNANLNVTRFKVPYTAHHQGRSGSFIDVIADLAQEGSEASNDADQNPLETPAEPSEAAHFGHAWDTYRFESWLHGSQVLDTPLRARYLDSPEHQAEALASQWRAVREASYVPAATPLLFK